MHVVVEVMNASNLKKKRQKLFHIWTMTTQYSTHCDLMVNNYKITVILINYEKNIENRFSPRSHTHLHHGNEISPDFTRF